MDFPYLAKVTALNVATIARLAAAPAAPATVSIDGALSTDTTVRWSPVAGAAGYRIRWRRNDAQDWSEQRDVTGAEAVLKGVIVDDHFVAVSSLSASGAESVPTFAGRPPR